MGVPLRSCLLLAFSATATTWAQPDRPLPEQVEFLRHVRSTLQSDHLLQRRYIYRETCTSIRRDDQGVEIGRTEKIIEHPVLKPGETLAQLDNRQRAERDDRRKENEIVDDAFRLYRFQLTGRETLDGYGVIAVTFTPEPGVIPRTSEGKMLQKFSGRALVAERDHQLMRLEVESTDDVTFGLGILARLHKGSQMAFERRPVNDVWLPSELRYRGDGRVLLVKKMRVEEVRQYSEYRPFNLGTVAALSSAR
jgi:hypothetical protein